MSEEIKDLQRKVNNLESRLGGIDLQVKGFYEAMESVRLLAQSMAEVYAIGAHTPVAPTQEGVDKGVTGTWPVLEEGKYVQALTGIIVDDIVIREVQAQGKPTPIANFNFTDGVTVVRVAIWDELISELEGLGRGDMLTLTAMSIKKSYEGVQQIGNTRKTTIE